MTTHAHITAGLLPATSERTLLPHGPRLIATGGPVSNAVRVMRTAAPQTAADIAILALAAGVARYLAAETRNEVPAEART